MNASDSSCCPDIAHHLGAEQCVAKFGGPNMFTTGAEVRELCKLGSKASPLAVRHPL